MDRGERAVKFIEKLKHSKGKWAGQPVLLQPWQRDYIRKLFGTLNPDGLRQYRTSLLFVPRKNGKTTLAAATALLALVCDDEEGAEIYSAAADREQANLVMAEAVNMVRQNPTLSKLLTIRESRKTIYYRDKRSFYRAISADAHTKHGFNASVVIYDELHAAPNRDLWDVLTTSMAARQQPLTLAITTAGYDQNSICYEIYDYAKKVQSGAIIDPTFLPVIYEAAPDDDFESEIIHRKANPNYDVSVNPEYFHQQLQKIKETPSYLNTFLRLHLNRWTSVESAWVDQQAWQDCGKLQFDKETLLGKECYAGLDLAATSDLCAFIMVFPLDDGTYAVLCEFFCPGDNAHDRENKDRVPYETWARQGHIHLTSGNVVDYQVILNRIMELRQQYRIKEVAVDMLFQGVQTAEQLRSAGFQVKAFGQGWRSMSAPVLEIEKLIMGRKLIHFNNPVLNWNAGNCIVKQDEAGNLKLDKSRSREKIDGMVGVAMGLGLAMQRPKQVLLKGSLLI